MPWVDKCLPSLLSSIYPVDIVVLDNGSGDGSVDYVKTHYPSVMVVDNHANLGFGKANNIGIHHAIDHGYDAVLLINQDAWMDADALGKMMDVLAIHPDYGIISPIHKNGKGNQLDKGFAVYTALSDIQHLPTKKDVVEVPFINAAIWLIKVETLKKTGLFAPLFYHYGEDKDLANRMTYYHYKIGYVPSASGYHDREFRKTGREKYYWSEYVYHLSEFANINYPIAKAIAKGVIAPAVKAISSAAHGRWRDAIAYVKLSFKILYHSNEVAITRKMSKHVVLDNY